jgi:hypothetical protein
VRHNHAGLSHAYIEPVILLRLKFATCYLHSVITRLLTCRQSSSGSEPEEKHEYEDEAEESVDGFINDDDETDASGSANAAQLRSACAAMRNRRSWRAMQSACPVCADLRAILMHLLDLH